MRISRRPSPGFAQTPHDLDYRVLPHMSLQSTYTCSSSAEGLKDVVMQDLRNLKAVDKTMQLPPNADEIMLLGLYNYKYRYIYIYI